MIVFTIVGAIVCGLIALAVLAVLVAIVAAAVCEIKEKIELWK